MVENEMLTADHLRNTYPSMQAFTDECEQRYDSEIDDLNTDRDWRGGPLSEIVKLGRYGWPDAMPDALTAAENAVRTVEKDHELTTFHQQWDVAGSVVDIGAYLAGDPECMIEYPLAPTVKTGRVITLCASMAISGSVDPEHITARGQVVTAFALALSKLGYSLELWMDFTTTSFGGRRGDGKKTATARVLVKGANDSLDPAKVQFAFAHPGLLRGLGFAWMHGLPGRFRQALNVGHGYGIPKAPRQDLPDGTIYLPDVCTSRDRPNLGDELLALLKQAGVVE